MGGNRATDRENSLVPDGLLAEEVFSMLKLVVAPDSFKGSLTARRAAAVLAQGLNAALPRAEVIQIPLADGGEGTVEVLLEAVGGQKHLLQVQGPAGMSQPVLGAWAQLADGLGVVEVAAASGLPLARTGDGGPLRRTSFGTGQLVREALRALDPTTASDARPRLRRLMLALGGSATVDGGCGLLRALGYRFLDAAGNELEAVGGELSNIAKVDVEGRDPRLDQTEILLACDVQSLLLGPRGAARLFGPQKGASPEEVEILEAGLGHLAKITTALTGVAVEELPGGGAAGGMGAFLSAYLGGRIRWGADLVLEAVGFSEKLIGASAVFTGEGRVDAGTMEGKIPLAVLRAVGGRCPVFVLAGELGDGADRLLEAGAAGIISLVPGPVSREEAMARGEEYLAAAGRRLGRMLEQLWAATPERRGPT